MHALIIEDESLIAMSIEDILADCGFTSFDVVSSAEQAVVAARLRCPDLITADVQLNPGSGIDAVDQICGGPPIPVIFITGSPADVLRRMPHHPLIEKPFTKEVVTRAVRFAPGDSGKGIGNDGTHPRVGHSNGSRHSRDCLIKGAFAVAR